MKLFLGTLTNVKNGSIFNYFRYSRENQTKTNKSANNYQLTRNQTIYSLADSHQKFFKHYVAFVLLLSTLKMPIKIMR